MRTPETVFSEHLCAMQDLAFQKFRETRVRETLRERAEQMENDCKNNFSEDDCAYIEAWVEANADLDGEESCFMYLQGHRDCVELLRALKVIG